MITDTGVDSEIMLETSGHDIQGFKKQKRREETANFRQKFCQANFPTELIMGAQNSNLPQAPKFLQNQSLQLQILHLWTKIFQQQLCDTIIFQRLRI